MGFADDIKSLSERIGQIGDKIQTEEATKMSMILPFFQILGYDVFDPSEFFPEFTADVGIKKGEKVDYAIMSNGEPIILIECKWCGKSLEKHGSQLFRYFSTTPAKFGILTNGYNYRFYTDLDEMNKMDLSPFFEFDLRTIKENQIAELGKFCKSSFDKDDIFSRAGELKYTSLIKSVLRSELEEPTEEFTKFLLSSFYDGVKTQRVIEKFKPIVKKSYSAFINELVNEKITSALSQEQPPEEADKDSSESEAPEPEEKKNKIITTPEEIESYYIIKSILSESIEPKRVTYRDAESYFSVLIDDNNRRPVCRLNLDAKQKYVMFPLPDKTFERCNIDAIYDLYSYKSRFIEIVKKYIRP